ncbi:hypothetical protein [Nitrosococcus wardiae]|uniref:Uncharacterized protein n=1 Tax=Nitrosococcus wardiae TaxID=1814290 RepID=A0A4P7BXU1_9GAMM|nr:hypothetical protein [Nitrosococcus wardiae]QBQ54841.1 hypothetical protein E3U44_10205 [Nitrosococcus wardiae]
MAGSNFEQARHRHESTDVNERSIVWVAFGIIVILIVSGIIVFGLLIYFGGHWQGTLSGPQQVGEKKKILPPPYFQGHQNLREEKEDLLYSYGWVNKEKGIVHIPIERAMNFLIERKALIHREKSRKQVQEKE